LLIIFAKLKGFDLALYFSRRVITFVKMENLFHNLTVYEAGGMFEKAIILNGIILLSLRTFERKVWNGFLLFQFFHVYLYCFMYVFIFMSTLYLRILKFVIMVIMIIYCWKWLCEVKTYKFEINYIKLE